MPRRARKSKFAALVFILLCAGIAFFVYTQGGPPYVKELAERTKEHFHPTPHPPTAQEGQAKSYTVGNYGLTFTYAGNPVPTTYPNSITVLTNTAFLVGYDDVRENPAWVAYRIPADTRPDTLSRLSRFKTDTRTTALVSHDDYTHSGYDRGHMAPKHAIASRFGNMAQIETFIMSNVVPQKPDLNQGPWRRLEETLADQTAPAAGEIWVVTGPIYDNQPQHLKAGNEIPDAFFKVIADETPSGPRLQAFILPQSAPRSADYRAYRTTIDIIEQQTGLDFFTDLPDVAEEILEAEKTPYWLEL